TPLLVASQAGYPNIATALLQAGADPNAHDPLGNLAIHLAAAANKLYTLGTLRDLGVDLNARTSSGKSLMHMAAEDGDADRILALSELGVLPMDAQSSTEIPQPVIL